MQTKPGDTAVRTRVAGPRGVRDPTSSEIKFSLVGGGLGEAATGPIGLASVVRFVRATPIPAGSATPPPAESLCWTWRLRAHPSPRHCARLG